MSWRQAAEIAETTINAEIAEIAEKTCFLCVLSDLCVDRRVFVVESVVNGRHLPRSQRFEEAPRVLDVKFEVACFDAEKEAVPAGEREPGDVEHGVIRHRE